jgi:hypothetical protein
MVLAQNLSLLAKLINLHMQKGHAAGQAAHRVWGVGLAAGYCLQVRAGVIRATALKSALRSGSCCVRTRPHGLGTDI